MPRLDLGLPKIKRPLFVLLLPFLLSPIYYIYQTKATICACVVFYMSILWITEIIPMAATALIPMVAYPIFGIIEAKDLCFEYLTDANFVFFGSLIMAIGIESVLLHERIALMILMSTGTNPRWLMLGFQVSTAFLSMFMSNTATAAMMLPIVTSVICELDYCRRKHVKGSENIVKREIDEISFKNSTERDRNTYKCLLLSICFSASIGGIATIIGSGPNLIMAAFLEELYQGNSPVTFASWMFYAFPQLIIMITFLWLWLQVLFIGFTDDPNEKEIEEVLHQVLEKKYKDLGPIQYKEKVISLLFAGMVLSWFFRDPKIFDGWGNLFPHGYVSDSTVSLFFAILLFIVPSQNPFINNPILSEKQKTFKPILTWKLVNHRMSWGTILLLGGGYAMAKGVEKSGLSLEISNQLSLLKDFPNWVFVIFTCILVTGLTEFSSNIATASIFIPLVASIAKNKETNPLLYILPATLSSSFAFMFPAGTPPNAIVFSAGLLRVVDLMKAGALLNIFGFFVIIISTQTYGSWIFDIKDAPLNLTSIQ
uniref:Uncharacterized protein n=1 Tax=Panagrolaimus sp. PS1159 TaxID=55785 RepID=A0AC35GEK8_9BILA